LAIHLFIYSETGITSAEQTELLDEHNRLRQLVALGKVYGQPGAENMQEMVIFHEFLATEFFYYFFLSFFS
jgi:hypothetical protein